MNLGKRIKTALDMAGLTAPQVARAADVEVTSLNALMRRDSRRSEFTERLLTAIPEDRVNHAWVRTGLGTPAPVTGFGPVPTMKETTRLAIRPAFNQVQSMPTGLAEAPLRSWEHPTELPPGEWVFVPKLGIMLAHPGRDLTITTVLMREEIQAFKTSWIRDDQLQPAALAWHEQVDESMEPAICKGDSFVVDTSETNVLDGKTYAIWYGHALHPRRVFMLPTGGLRMTPLNADFIAVDVPQADIADLKILGRIVHRSGTGGL